MELHFSSPGILWGLALCLIPLLLSLLRQSPYPSLYGVPKDPLSSSIRIGLILAQIIAIAAVVVALAGPHFGGGVVQRSGSGAQIVLLLDRSSSMDLPFDRDAGHTEPKRKIAVRLLDDFVERSTHDQFGVIPFSTMPAVALPLTDSRDAIKAAIHAMDRRGIDGTNIGLSLVAGADLIAQSPNAQAPAIILVSDGQFGGAGHFERDLKQKLGAALRRENSHLYWLFLRPQSESDVLDPPPVGEADTPFTRPERHMDLFFKDLGVPYRLFQAGDPEAIDKALAEIKSLATRPITFDERIPTTDLAVYFYALAAIAAGLLTLAKLAEVDLVTAHPSLDRFAGLMRRSAFRDPRFWLLASATALLLVALSHPRIERAVDVFRLLATIDVTRSMNTRDLSQRGTPVSRLDGVKNTLRTVVAQLPCGSEFGLAIFADRRSFLLFEPVDVCTSFAAIDGAISGLGWRMAWTGDSHIATGLFDAIAVAGGVSADAVFLTDGHEAPPLPAAGGPSFDGEPAKIKGLIVGVGGDELSPIPKYDDRGGEIGFLGPDDVEHENRLGMPTLSVAEMIEGQNARNSPFGPTPAMGQEHLSSLRRSYLQGLARETGLAYSDLTDAAALAGALKVSTAPRSITSSVDARPLPAGLALILILSGYLTSLAARNVRAIDTLRRYGARLVSGGSLREASLKPGI